MSTDAAMAMDAAALTKVHPEARPYSGQALSIQTQGGKPPTWRTARYVLTLNGREVYSRLSVVAVGDWVIEQRVSGPLDMSMLGDALGEALRAITVNSAPK